jgi:hypothetical protein
MFEFLSADKLSTEILSVIMPANGFGLGKGGDFQHLGCFSGLTFAVCAC